MRFQQRFFQSLDRIAIPNITAYWVAFQALCMMLIWARPAFAESLLFNTALVLQGEWWRAITFLFMPASLSPIWAAFVLYFYWLMGSALEANWGIARYNLYLLLGVLLNIGAAFLPFLAGHPGGIGSNAYILESVFLAFAALYPDFIIRLFFIIPVRIKWLALLTWVLLLVQFVLADWTGKAMVVASIANFLLFFARDIVERLRHGQKLMHRQFRRMSATPIDDGRPMNKCVVCGATERTAPHLEFRYCPSCGNKCYCLEHLRTHPCMTPANTPR